MNKLLLMQIIGQCNYGYNPEYENLSEEEKSYMDYVDECLSEIDEKFKDACTKTMLLILEVYCKIGTDEEPTNEEVELKKDIILSGFNQKDKDKLETFMYACIQTIGIYSEERVKERKTSKDKTLSKKNNNNNGNKDIRIF